MVDVLKSIFPSCPARTGVQFQLFASPHIKDTLRQYANLRVEDGDQSERAKEWGRPARNSNVYRALARRRVEHYLNGAQRSLAPGYHFTIRDFRLLVSVSLPGSIEQRSKIDEAITLRDSISATLRAADLFNVQRGAEDLINWCALFTNPDRLFQREPAKLRYDDGREIRDQIIDSDTLQDATPYGLHFGKLGHEEEQLEVRFYSIKSFPEEYPLWQMGALIGDLMQPSLQYPCPFLITMGVHVLDPTSSRTAITTNHWRATQNARSSFAQMMPDVQKKLEDWTDMAQTIDQGGAAVSMYHQIALFFPTAECGAGGRVREGGLAGTRLRVEQRRLHASPGFTGESSDDDVTGISRRSAPGEARIAQEIVECGPPRGLDRRMARHQNTHALAIGPARTAHDAGSL